MSGTTQEATAAIPKKTEPSRFRLAIRRWVSAAAPHRGQRERARDEEADRSERVGRPDADVLLLGRERVVHGRERRDVEEDRPHELDAGRPPVQLVEPGRLAELEQRRPR